MTLFADSVSGPNFQQVMNLVRGIDSRLQSPRSYPNVQSPRRLSSNEMAMIKMFDHLHLSTPVYRSWRMGFCLMPTVELVNEAEEA